MDSYWLNEQILDINDHTRRSCLLSKHRPPQYNFDVIVIRGGTAGNHGMICKQKPWAIDQRWFIQNIERMLTQGSNCSSVSFAFAFLSKWWARVDLFCPPDAEPIWTFSRIIKRWRNPWRPRCDHRVVFLFFGLEGRIGGGLIIKNGSSVFLLISGNGWHGRL